jgi:hypothetical protein
MPWKLSIVLIETPTALVSRAALPVWREQWSCPEPPANLEDEQLTDWVYAQVCTKLAAEGWCES